MSDRDTLLELFSIITDITETRSLPLTRSALPYMEERFGSGCDVYFRRRLSVCKMLIGLHLPVSDDYLDVLLAATLSHYLPGDRIPDDYPGILKELFKSEPRVAEVFAILRQSDYLDMSYYEKVIENPYALIIRLTERGVLVETLYEWSVTDAIRYIRETREHFLPMCLYAKENYTEFLGAASILMEKIKSLLLVNEALIYGYDEIESSLRTEILDLREENAAMRLMINELMNN